MSENRLDDILKDLSQKAFEHTGIRIGVDIVYNPDALKQMQVDTYNKTEGNLNEFDGYNCSLCKNKGFIARLDENGYEVHCFCKCHKIRETLRRAKRSGLGDILSDMTFEKYKASEQWQIELKNTAQAFCKDDEAKWFFIGGQVGSGKTHLCTAIAAHYIKEGYDTQYMLWVEESKKLKAIVNEYYLYQEETKKYKDAPVLYIDDFLKTQNGEQPTKGDINVAFEILNHRLMNPELITIVSSEKTLTDILTYDEATMSRIYQKAGKYKKNIGKDIKKNYRLRDVL